MKRLRLVCVLFALLVFLCSPLLLFAATQKGTTLHAGYVGIGDANGKVLDVAGYTTATFEVSGTFSGTVTPQVSLSGSAYTVLTCFQLDGTTPITSFVSTGSWRCNITGHGLLRAPISGYISGTVIVNVTVTDGGTAITKLNGGSGGGGGGAPVDYPYWGLGNNSTLVNEISLSGFSGLVLNTGGNPSAYPGFTCTNQVPRLLTSIGGTTCVTITASYVDGSIALTGVSNNWADGVRQIFNPDLTNAGFNVGLLAGDPSNPQDGDFWFNTNTNKCRLRQAGTNFDCLSGGGGASTFDTITAGTNTNPLVMGSGGTLLPSGTGIIGSTTLRPQITTVNGGNSPYTVTVNDLVLLCDTTGGSRVINLIAATNNNLFQFKNLGSNSCTINRAGADLIDGGTTATLTIQYEAIGLYSNGGTSWNVF